MHSNEHSTNSDSDNANQANFIPLNGFVRYPEEEMLSRAEAFYKLMRRRRTVRSFSTEPIPRDVIEECLLVAGSAPNGANLQPWHFVVVTDPVTKRRIRLAAEEEEKEFYQRRAPEEWLETLEPFGTNWVKPYLEDAPALIAIFALRYEIADQGQIRKYYYVQESVGIATGMLITALHHAGLASLTHTPSPMGFLNQILGRPENEKPFLLLVVGYPSANALVPDIQKKQLSEISTFI